jgi:hypothetical protein
MVELGFDIETASTHYDGALRSDALRFDSRAGSRRIPIDGCSMAPPNLTPAREPPAL